MKNKKIKIIFNSNFLNSQILYKKGETALLDEKNANFAITQGLAEIVKSKTDKSVKEN